MKQTQLIILISITLGAIFATLFVNRPQLTRAAPNSGVVGTGTPASCTEAALRTALAGGGSVTFNCGSSVATITLTQQIVVTSTTSVNGLPTGIILTGNNATRLFHVQSGVLHLREINLRYSNANGSNGGVALVDTGAGLEIIGGIHGGNQASFGGVVSNFGTLTMTYGLYFFNHAEINGGVLDNVGTATLTDVAIQQNSAGVRGGGLYNYLGTLTLQHELEPIVTEASRNTSGGYGGGIANDAGQLNITGWKVWGNTTTGPGGGIYNNGPALLHSVTISENISGGAGGGIYSVSPLTVTGVIKINGNLSGGSGGALFTGDAGSLAGATSLEIAGNRSGGEGGGIFVSGTGSLQIANADLVSNTARSTGGGLSNRGVLDLSLTSLRGNQVTDTLSLGGGLFNGGSAVITGVQIIQHNVGYLGGGLANTQTLTLTDVILNDNAAHYQQLNLEPNGAGGGVYNTGRLSATGLTLNFATANGAGAIANLGTLDLTNALIADAASLNCTGLYNAAGASATLTRVTIARNLAFIDELSGNGGGYGSALCNDGQARLEATSVISNYARVFAAGIWNNGNLELENTTIANNTLDAGLGGDGIAISTSGVVTADNVSIAGNVAEFTSTLPIHALIATGAGRFVLKNTLIAETPAEQNCTGTVISLGHNLSDDSSCPLSATGDLTNTPALLLPLGDYGGSTFTRPPSKNSPAIDKGTNTDCPTSDQRGYARPADGDLNGNASCDIGAVEITPQHVFLPLIQR